MSFYYFSAYRKKLFNLLSNPSTFTFNSTKKKLTNNFISCFFPHLLENSSTYPSVSPFDLKFRPQFKCLSTANLNHEGFLLLPKEAKKVYENEGDSIKEEKLDENEAKTKNRTSNEIVEELNRHIIGQHEAKKSLAIALRDRWRRQHIKCDGLRKEITPNNILLIGPSGCGKTELAKRLAAFADAPFVKVVATKYTEVGFVGDDTQSMVQDLAEQALADEKGRRRKKVANEAREKAYVTISKIVKDNVLYRNIDESDVIKDIKEGNLDDLQIEIDENLLNSRDDSSTNPLSQIMNSFGTVKGGPKISPVGMAISTLPGSDLSAFMGDVFGGNKKNLKKAKRKLRIKDAVPLVEDHYASEMINEDDVFQSARQSAEQRGIIFIDEFDKLIDAKEGAEFRSKRRGVQKELLTLMEGTTVSTRIGRVSTDHILFIASGSFISSKPSDIMHELQGRLPIRSDLKPLTEEDFVKILVETQYNLLMQQKAMLETENVTLVFSEDAIKQIAKIAHHLNTVTANVGARRLKTVIAKILEEIKFDVDKLKGTTVNITKEVVDSRLSQLLQQSDLSKYVI